MKAFTERYRRIPIALPMSPQYEALSADGKFILLALSISPRQTQPGIFDGTSRALEYETSLDPNRLKAALAELEEAGLVEAIPAGGWWVKWIYAWQVCNASYERAALRVLTDKWPDLLPRFKEHNAAILGREEKEGKNPNSPRDDRPPTDPPQCHSVSGSGSDPRFQGSDTGTGGRGHAGGGGVAKSRTGAFDAPSAFDLPRGGNSDGSNQKNLPSVAIAILSKVPEGSRASVEELYRDVLAGNTTETNAKELLKNTRYIQDSMIDRLLQECRQQKIAQHLSSSPRGRGPDRRA